MIKIEVKNIWFFFGITLLCIDLKFGFSRDDLLPPPKSFEAIGSSPSSLWIDYSDDQEMGMCVSVDPDSGYRWSTRYCNGPDKAAFVCQIPGKKIHLKAVFHSFNSSI